MRRKNSRPRRSECPLNAALEMVGDRWSLLIVRDLMLGGQRTYKAFLAGGERIATNVLADRLAKLEEIGILGSVRDPSDRRRIHYKLTAKGIDLAPVLIELVLWASRHERTAVPKELLDEMVHHRRRFLTRLKRRWSAME